MQNIDQQNQVLQFPIRSQRLKANRILTDQEEDAKFLEKYPPIKGLNAENTIFEDGLIVIFNGKKIKLLKRYLKRKYNLEFEDYIRIYKLGDNYPSVAPSLSKAMSTFKKFNIHKPF